MTMKMRVLVLLAVTMAFAGLSLSDPITAFQSYPPVLSGGTVADFEGFAEFTVITNQYAGMTFSQTGGGAPWIDNYDENGGANGCGGEAWCYAYGASSGSGVLTGSTQGGNVVTTAGIIVTFATPQSNVQAFLSDTSPLGDYTITAYGAGDTLLDTETVLESALPGPAYTGDVFPAPGTFPLPGIYVGFEDSLPDIVSIQIGPSSSGGDAFAVDDVSFGGTSVPEPSSLALLAPVALGMFWILRRKLA
ncbi:MAG TPA: PEP-CTERM sorting domain-containing protein [Bryobacteraceae bacterium]|nr:PEP-CTERM sorting domain-containing protein [Bryobacteraceae bacterium]